mmetsp:Transcript_151314/g.263753  ORF Transcript_151314/g.263753 Transcript_151314/m.263753 type:complete len:317 (+) Transcript_151314:297-1247(+)
MRIEEILIGQQSILCHLRLEAFNRFPIADVCIWPGQSSIRHDVWPHASRLHLLKNLPGAHDVSSFRTSVKRGAVDNNVRGEHGLLCFCQPLAGRCYISFLGARIDKCTEGVQIRLHIILNHVPKPKLSTIQILGLSTNINHCTVAHNSELHLSRNHFLHPLLGTLQVTRFGTSIHNGCVSCYPCSNTSRFHLQSPAFCTLSEATSGTGIDQRVVAHHVWLHASLQCFPLPFFSRSKISALSPCMDHGGVTDIGRLDTCSNHPLQPNLCCRGIVRFCICIHQDVVADGVRFHSAAAHFVKPGFRTLEVVLPHARVHH